MQPAQWQFFLVNICFVNISLYYPGRCAGLEKEAAELQTNAAGILFGVTSAHSESIQRE